MGTSKKYKPERKKEVGIFIVEVTGEKKSMSKARISEIEKLFG